MFTIQSLRDLASTSEAEYRRLLALFPPGTVNDERNKAHETMDQALASIAWMESNGHVEIAHVGVFQSFTVKKGQRLRLKKGSPVFSTAPGFGKDGKPSVRRQDIKVHDVDAGWIDPDTGAVRQPRVNWVGGNFYWRSSDLNNFELIPD